MFRRLIRPGALLNHRNNAFGESSEVVILNRRLLSILLFFGGGTAFCLVGCDRTTRYKVLTFFFEGVPSPDGNVSDAEKQPIIVTNTGDRQDIMNPEGRVVEPDRFGQRLSSRHDFAKDCAQCHTGGLSSGQQELRKPLPDLCYSCHTDLHQEGDYLHGPLNVGECIFCHDPHQSAYVHLQKSPQPQLCYQCHLKENIAVIPGHEECLDGVCTDCHNPHSSADSKLLKTNEEKRGDPNSID